MDRGLMAFKLHLDCLWRYFYSLRDILRIRHHLILDLLILNVFLEKLNFLILCDWSIFHKWSLVIIKVIFKIFFNPLIKLLCPNLRFLISSQWFSIEIQWCPLCLIPSNPDFLLRLINSFHLFSECLCLIILLPVFLGLFILQYFSPMIVSHHSVHTCTHLHHAIFLICLTEHASDALLIWHHALNLIFI